MKTLSQGSYFVKAPSNWRPVRFAFMILENYHRGKPDTIAFLPSCSACGEIIWDMENANIEAVDGKPIPAGDIDGLPISRLPGEVYAFHVPECAQQKLVGPWKKLNTVVRSDQRYAWEK
jgi:hypothetical protein